MKRIFIVLALLTAALQSKAEIISGKCGDNLTYILDTATGVLDIKGEGDMTNYAYAALVPWYNYASFIKQVNISNSATSIGNWAFCDCCRLKTITIPRSIKNIGEYAFEGYPCQLSHGYYGYPEEYMISYSLGLASIIVDSDNQYYSSYDGVLFNKDKTELIRCPAQKEGVFYIPNSVTTIRDVAFSYCYKLTEVSIPNSVTSIGNYAFRWCSRLAHITIGNSVKSIGKYAFSYCIKLTSITIPGSVTSIAKDSFFRCINLANINVINNASQEYTSVNGVLFNNDFTTLFLCPPGKNGEYTIPDFVTSIDEKAFYECQQLTSVTIPSSINSIGDNAFGACTDLFKITCESTTPPVVGTHAFHYFQNVYVPSTSIDAYKSSAYWKDCGRILEIGINQRTTNDNTICIEAEFEKGRQHIFFNTYNIERMYIDGKEVTVSRDYDFPESGVYNIEVEVYNSTGNYVPRIFDALSASHQIISVVLPPQYTKFQSENFGIDWSEIRSVSCYNCDRIDDNAFDGCHRLTNAPIGYNVNYIGKSAFAGCYSLTSVNIPNNVSYIGEGAFSDCWKLKEFNVSYSNPYYCSYWGILFNCDRTTLIQCPGGYEGVFLIPNTVKRIENGAFKHSGLTYVRIPSSVTYIGKNAFVECKDLETIDVDPDNQYFTSVDGVLYNKDKTVLIQYPPIKDDEYQIPSSVTSICSDAFRRCYDLKTIYCTAKEVPHSDSRIDCPNSGSHNDCILYVPSRLVDAYKAAEQWKDWTNILPIEQCTDITNITNTLYVGNMELNKNYQAVIPVKLKNTASVTAFQFDLHLPAGMTVALDADNDPMVELASDRKTISHTLSTNILSDGTLSMGCFSGSSKSFSGNDGAVVYVTVNIDENMEEGYYEYSIDNLELTAPNNTVYHELDRCMATITLESYMLGDVNNDKKITISDAVGIVNFVIRSNTEGLNEKAADANGDGTISISDAVYVVNQVIGLTQSAKSMAKAASNVSNNAALLRMEDTDAIVGKSFNVPVMVEPGYTAMQFMLHLPEGMVLEDIICDSRHMASFSENASGDVMVAVFAMDNSLFTGSEALTLQLRAADNGNAEEVITITDAELVNPDMQSAEASAASAVVRLGDSTGINTVDSADAAAPSYTIQGTLHRAHTRGISVQNGKKTVVK